MKWVFIFLMLFICRGNWKNDDFNRNMFVFFVVDYVRLEIYLYISCNWNINVLFDEKSVNL